MHQVPIALTKNITSGHPVTAGVDQLWYPTAEAYNAQHTGPVTPTATRDGAPGPWKCLVNAMSSTTTKAVDLNHSSFDGPPASDRTFLPFGSVAPCMFAVRDFQGGGRIAAFNQWSQYTLGTGLVDYWLFEKQVMEVGDGHGRGSDMAKLMDNLWRWLAVPPDGVAAGLGGYTTNATRLEWSNDLPGAKDMYNESCAS